MASRYRVVLAFVAVMAVLALAQPASAGVIFFDDFSVGNGGGGSNLVPSGWYVTPGSGTVEVVGPTFFGFLCAGGPSPSHCVDLDGSTGNAGILNRDFALGAGQYVVSFWYRGNARGGTDDFTVGFGGFASYPFSGILAATGWTQFSFLVTVPSAQSVTLSFANAGGDNIGILLDNVQIDAVPEPGTLLLIGSGLTGLALRRRRRG
jgi:hypothetical protein